MLTVVRPNLGCRTLVYQHFSKMLTGIVHDIADWVPATRVKSAQLLYTLLINEEENVTQHLDKVLAGLFRACSDDEADVRTYVSALFYETSRCYFFWYVSIGCIFLRQMIIGSQECRVDWLLCQARRVVVSGPAAG